MTLNETECVTLCPLWGTVATHFPDPAYDGKHIRSYRAGGRFDVTGSVDSSIQNLGQIEKVKLSRWIFEQNSLGAIPELTSRVGEHANLLPTLDVQQRAHMLLKFLEHETAYVGDVISLDYEMPHQRTESLALAASQSVESSEVLFLCNYLMRRGWVETKISYDHYDITLSVDGYVRLSELADVLSTSSQAFVAMWFSDETAKSYSEGIEPAVLSCGYNPLRIDAKETIQKVDDEIIAEIRASRFVIADFTSQRDRPRGGVYFEAGFAMGLQRPVIWMCRADLIDQLHFDTRQFSHICWSDPNDLREKLANRILAVLGRGPLRAT